MTTRLRVSSVGFTAARDHDVRSGLLGFVYFVLNDSLLVDGVTLRRTRHGRLTLSFPSRLDGQGRRHFHLRPTDERARLDLENQILTALGCREEASS